MNHQIADPPLLYAMVFVREGDKTRNKHETLTLTLTRLLSVAGRKRKKKRDQMQSKDDGGEYQDVAKSKENATS